MSFIIVGSLEIVAAVVSGKGQEWCEDVQLSLSEERSESAAEISCDSDSDLLRSTRMKWRLFSRRMSSCWSKETLVLVVSS